jgi:hypothetical protein
MQFRTTRTSVRPPAERLGGQLPPDSTQLQLRVVFMVWLLAFLLKHAGSAWDIAWHFRYVFGALEPPHWLNAAGSALAAVLLWYQMTTGRALDRAGFLVMQIAFVIFVISMPLDVLNHSLFGLDVTVWSPTHMLGFAATSLMMVGLLQSWLRLAAPGRWRLTIGLICCAFLLDDAIFMLGQQEYGVIALEAYARGVTTASPELLAQAGRDPERFISGGIPSWVYPVWMILTGTLVFVAAHRMLEWRWTALAVALIYLAFRVAGRLLLGALDFPVSFIPVMLLLGAFIVDVAETRQRSPATAALAIVATYYASAALIGRYTLMPEFAITSAPFVFAGLWLMLARPGLTRITHRPMSA